MPRTTQHPKDSSFNFRIDPALKTAFAQAAEAEDKPAAQVLRDFMRAYVRRRADEAEARRQSREAARHRLDPDSDDHVSLREYEALLDADPVADWKA